MDELGKEYIHRLHIMLTSEAKGRLNCGVAVAKMVRELAIIVSDTQRQQFPPTEETKSAINLLGKTYTDNGLRTNGVDRGEHDREDAELVCPASNHYVQGPVFIAAQIMFAADSIRMGVLDYNNSERTSEINENKESESQTKQVQKSKQVVMYLRECFLHLATDCNAIARPGSMKQSETLQKAFENLSKSLTEERPLMHNVFYDDESVGGNDGVSTLVVCLQVHLARLNLGGLGYRVRSNQGLLECRNLSPSPVGAKGAFRYIVPAELTRAYDLSDTNYFIVDSGVSGTDYLVAPYEMNVADVGETKKRFSLISVVTKTGEYWYRDGAVWKKNSHQDSRDSKDKDAAKTFFARHGRLWIYSARSAGTWSIPQQAREEQQQSDSAVPIPNRHTVTPSSHGWDGGYYSPLYTLAVDSILSEHDKSYINALARSGVPSYCLATFKDETNHDHHIVVRIQGEGGSQKVEAGQAGASAVSSAQ